MNKKIVTVLSLALATAIVGNANATEDVYNRAAVGNMTVTGGASRIHGDMNKMYESQIKLAKKEHAKNVILLIGDGMGDSELLQLVTLLMVLEVISQASMLYLSQVSTLTIL